MVRRLALAAVVALLALGIGLRLGSAELTPAGLAQNLRDLGSSSLWPFAFVALYVVLTAAAVPAMIFHIAAGVIWGFWPGLALNVLLANAVSSLHFAAARAFGAGPLRAFLQRKGLDQAFDRARTEGPWAMIAARQLPLPQVAVNVAAGASPMPWSHFAVGSAVGGLVPQALWTWFAAEVFDGPASARPDIALKAAAAALLALGFAIALRTAARRRAAPRG